MNRKLLDQLTMLIGSTILITVLLSSNPIIFILALLVESLVIVDICIGGIG